MLGTRILKVSSLVVWASSEAGRRAMGYSCFLRRGEEARLGAGAGRLTQLLPRDRKCFGFPLRNKVGTKEIVTGGVCTGLSGPPDLPECTCMWLQVWAMGKAKHDHRDHL